MKFGKTIIALIAAASLALSGCSTMQATFGNTSEAPLTVRQKIARCAAMTVGGAVLGAVIGNNVGSGNAGTGAAVGAAAGLGTCAIWLAFNNQQDQARIERLQMQSASSGRAQNETWVGADGRPRSLTVASSTATQMQVQNDAGTERRMCRTMNTTATVSGHSDQMSQVWCRQADGSYTPLTDGRTVSAA